MPQNSLTLVIDASGVYYRVPIACINDPEKYEVDAQEEILQQREKMKETDIREIKLKVRSTKGDRAMKISNAKTILEFKQLYLEESGQTDLKPE